MSKELHNEPRKKVTNTVPIPPTLPPTPVSPIGPIGNNEESRVERLLKCIYNRDTGEIFLRTPKSWALILSYSVMYLIFLITFTLIYLYVSLQIMKQVVDYRADGPKIESLTYPEHSIGLTATPTSETNVPLIWYKNGDKVDYEKYIHAIDKFLLTNRRKREDSSLGPCGQPPYGYGDKPCVIVRINKQFHWAGKPLQFNSTMAESAPTEVKEWMRTDKTKLWLQCSGYHSYDKEHIGRIKYYPDPPGFDASVFPLDSNKYSPLVAIQLSDFTIGISLAIECTLWFETGRSTIDFVLYVAPGEKRVNV